MKDIIPEIEKIKEIDGYISSRTTGNIEEFSNKLKICERSVHNNINFMEKLIKEYGVTIVWNPVLNSYQYSDRGHIIIDIKFIKED